MRVLLLLIIMILAVPAYAADIPPECRAKLTDASLYKKHNMQSYEMLFVGQDGWVFRSSSDFIADFKPDKRAIESMKSMQEAFAKRGITLVLAVPPTRGIVGSDYLPEDNDFQAKEALDSYRAMVSDLQSQGLHVVGVSDFNDGDIFFRKKDQHWHSHGARSMAETVASYVKSLPVYSALLKETFRTETGKAYTFEGRFNKAFERFCGITLPLENDFEYLSAPVDTDLFTDRPAPQIVLVGTSNSKADAFNANFDGFLKEFLSADVLNAAQPGLGFDEPMHAYLRSDDFANHPPKLIVWEIPSYYVFDRSQGDIFKTTTATLAGPCDDHSLFETELTLGKDEIVLFEGLEDKTSPSDALSIVFEFDQRIKRRFLIELTYNDDELSTKGVRIEPAKRQGHDHVYFSSFGTLPYSLKSITLHPRKDMDGTTLKASLCSL